MTALCSLFHASASEKDCGGPTIEHVQLGNTSHCCWYDGSTRALVGAESCGDMAVHCDNQSMCLSRGATEPCSALGTDVCTVDAGTDAGADAMTDASFDAAGD